MRYTAEWLIAHGFDGLYDACPDNDECGCPVSDLRPCDKDWRVSRKCRPGYKIYEAPNICVIGPKPEERR